MAEQWFCNFPGNTRDVIDPERAISQMTARQACLRHPKLPGPCSGQAPRWVWKCRKGDNEQRAGGTLIVTDGREASGMQPGGRLERSRD